MVVQAGGADGVAEGDGDGLKGESVDLVPLLAGEGDGLAVPEVVHVVHHQLEGHVGDAEVIALLRIRSSIRLRIDQSIDLSQGFCFCPKQDLGGRVILLG